jgi:LacI family transcriptional regulator
VVANVNAAIGLLTAAQARGLRVPDDLSVIAIHDSWICDHSSPPLTTLRMPVRAMGQAAVRLLHERLGGGQPADLEITDPPAELVERQSVRRHDEDERVSFPEPVEGHPQSVP